MLRGSGLLEVSSPKSVSYLTPVVWFLFRDSKLVNRFNQVTMVPVNKRRQQRSCRRRGTWIHFSVSISCSAAAHCCCAAMPALRLTGNLSLQSGGGDMWGGNTATLCSFFLAAAGLKNKGRAFTFFAGASLPSTSSRSHHHFFTGFISPLPRQSSNFARLLRANGRRSSG